MKLSASTIRFVNFQVSLLSVHFVTVHAWIISCFTPHIFWVVFHSYIPWAWFQFAWYRSLYWKQTNNFYVEKETLAWSQVIEVMGGGKIDFIAANCYTDFNCLYIWSFSCLWLNLYLEYSPIKLTWLRSN